MKEGQDYHKRNEKGENKSWPRNTLYFSSVLGRVLTAVSGDEHYFCYL